ncbi:hypothetical protein AB0395_39160, partial [Streptosporangium sp. NPDC051023]|uniref:hypothetical protein n=1 Tax=Streptosporangium sp. NPDC051023 TaxID=3155410 RepID=UPI00344D8BFC
EIAPGTKLPRLTHVIRRGAPTGFIASQMVADKVQTGSSTLPWRRVGLIQVALMSRANDPSSAIAPSEIPRLLGVQVAPSMYEVNGPG